MPNFHRESTRVIGGDDVFIFAHRHQRLRNVLGENQSFIPRTVSWILAAGKSRAISLLHLRSRKPHGTDAFQMGTPNTFSPFDLRYGRSDRKFTHSNPYEKTL
jgi:hypothetical protein